MKQISVSQISTYNTCQFKFDMIYNRQIVPAQRSDSTAIALGSMVHAGLAAALYAYHNDKHGENSDSLANQAAEAAISIWSIEHKPSGFVVSPIEGLIVLDAEDNWNGVASAAIGITLRTLKQLDVRRNYRTVVVDGQPLIEHELHYTVPPDNNFEFVGYIDWVCHNLTTGLTEIWDFKVRARLGEDETDYLSQQTAIYQYVLKELYGIHCPITCIGQIRSSLPEQPELNKPNKATGVAQMSRANITTDWETYRSALLAAGLDPTEYLDMRNKLATQEFWKFNRLIRHDYQIVRRFWNNFILTARQAYGMMYPVRQLGYPCKSCAFALWCKQEIEGYDPEELIGTEYQYREEK